MILEKLIAKCTETASKQIWGDAVRCVGVALSLRCQGKSWEKVLKRIKRQRLDGGPWAYGDNRKRTNIMKLYMIAHWPVACAVRRVGVALPWGKTLSTNQPALRGNLLCESTFNLLDESTCSTSQPALRINLLYESNCLSHKI